MPVEFDLPSIGLGAAPLGGLFEAVDPDDAVAAIDAAVQAGYGYVDTAPLYGFGASEGIVGRALAGRRDVMVSTKVGRIIDPGLSEPTGAFWTAEGRSARFDFSRDGIRRSFFDSLDRLGRDHIDIVFIHDPDDHADQAITEAYPALLELRDEGLLSWIGVGMNQPEVPMRFVNETDLDVVLIAGRYTLLDRSASHLLDRALERGVPVIAAGVYNSGILAPTTLPLTFDYRPAPAGLIVEARRLASVCAEFDIPLAAAAIQFPSLHPGVASVLIGARNGEEAIENLAYNAVQIPNDLWAQLGALT